MKKFRFIMFLCISFIVYAILSIILEKIDSSLIYNKFFMFLSCVIVIGLIITNIACNQKNLQVNMISYKKIIVLSLEYSFISSIIIFVARVIVSLILYGFLGLKESISWFAISALIGFGALFILYFIIFICFKNISNKEKN